ncbi:MULTISPECIES: flavin reductase family protein [Streptosporangium]|uniref:Flavin reductase (DIM6/NTAB) family NADH-FMN oxidoreductase RutF n=1 Tax=Streptosporangium brasiliense TaxID=47480 RepID=A0ABT9QW09_9ACTN|nr:flavin reductase family protein [Streptosporangium brasiliense]MDP9861166.1 flavin reductase (DIM6/NTAB) family NADH-FMN oxidoreductase RutF [Streptosporangium brasiliense]
MNTHAARLLEPDGHLRVTPGARGIIANGVAMHSGLPQGLSDGADNRAQAVDGTWFRSVLGHFATGVVAITAIDPDSGEPCGLAANSFTSVSLDPPLVAFCVAHTSTSWPRLRAAKSQTVNVLAEHQEAVCAALASRGGTKFAGLTWTDSPGGSPVIDEALAWIDCTIEAEYPAGDHVIVVARVHQLGLHGDGGPLLFFRGGYGRFRS